jgi:hypothetical protein
MATAATTTATYPTPQQLLEAALKDPVIKEAIHRGIRKTRVMGDASDFVQATYLALLEKYREEFMALDAEGRPKFVEKLAMRTAWHEVYTTRREVPLVKPLDADQMGNETERSQAFVCDDISLARNGRHATWISAHVLELELIDAIDRQRTGTLPEEQPETEYERRCRLLGVKNADWMLDYENHRGESAKTSAEKVRYHRLRKKEREGM